MVFTPTRHDKDPAYRLGALTLFVAAGVILTALGFEHLGGYAPCPLCLQQRYAYYAGLPLLFAALALVAADMPRMAALVFGAVALAFVANAGLGAYHAGVEWGLWPGPATCSGGATAPATVDELMQGLEREQPVRCDAASWTFAGLSFAGWNAVVSLALALGAAHAGRAAWARA